MVELVLSHIILGFPSDELQRFAAYVLENYGAYEITCDDYPALVADMRQDKKNSSPDNINFTLLENVGVPRININATAEQIGGALDIYRDTAMAIATAAIHFDMPLISPPLFVLSCQGAVSCS